MICRPRAVSGRAGSDGTGALRRQKGAGRISPGCRSLRKPGIPRHRDPVGWKGRGPDASVAAARSGVLPMLPTPSRRGTVTDGRQPVPTLVGRVRAAARPHLSARMPEIAQARHSEASRSGGLPMPPTRGTVTDGRQPVPTLVGRVRAAARPHLPARIPEIAQARHSEASQSGVPEGQGAGSPDRPSSSRRWRDVNAIGERPPEPFPSRRWTGGAIGRDGHS